MSDPALCIAQFPGTEAASVQPRNTSSCFNIKHTAAAQKMGSPTSQGVVGGLEGSKLGHLGPPGVWQGTRQGAVARVQQAQRLQTLLPAPLNREGPCSAHKSARRHCMSTQQPCACICRGLAGPQAADLHSRVLVRGHSGVRQYGLLQFNCSRAHAHAPAVHSQHASWQPRTCQVGVAVQPELVELWERRQPCPTLGEWWTPAERLRCSSRSGSSGWSPRLAGS